MSSVQIHTEITSSPLNLTAIRQWVGDPAAGAVVTFEGVVRDHDHGVGVTGITYSAHPSAADTLARVVAHFAECEGIRAIAVEHRVGQLIVGDVALALAVAGEHRREAFTCAMEIIDAVKAAVPIWKQQFLLEGGYEWGGLP